MTPSRRRLRFGPLPVTLAIAVVALVISLPTLALGQQGAGHARAAKSKQKASANADTAQDLALIKKNAPSLRGPQGVPGSPGAAGPAGPAGPTGTVDTSNFYTKAQSDGRYQQPTSRGSALAGANVASDGTLSRYFNQFGGAPTTSKASTGTYHVAFPGSSFGSANSLVMATPDGVSGAGTMINADYLGTSTIVVQTFDSSGTLADRRFHLVVFGASPTG